MNPYVNAYLAAIAGLRECEAALMCEHLPHKERPTDPGYEWLEDVPQGPSEDGIARLWTVQAAYGPERVTTGNANPPRRGMVGIYVKAQA
jgi:hypothetical protein